MKKTFFILFSLILSFSAFSQDFCARSQTDILRVVNSASARIAFKNAGGLFNGGVCWWHARLQRSSVYLARFEPNRPKPTPAQVNAILTNLRNMDKVVVIPGYANFNAFTKENQEATQKMLNSWQIYDGAFNQEWRRGISGRTSLPAADLEKQMVSVFDAYKNSPVPIWVMAQMKGITSHSFLIIDMVQQGNGFDMKVIDSNAPDKNKFIQYRYGQTSLTLLGGTEPFVLYVGFQNDFRLIAAALKNTCRGIMGDHPEFDDIKDGTIELPRGNE